MIELLDCQPTRPHERPAGSACEPLADCGGDVGCAPGAVHVDDRMTTGDADLAVAHDLPRPGERGAAELPKADANLDLVVEPQHAQVVRLHPSAWVVAPVAEQPEPSTQTGLGV